jgi:hypothetical protein
MCCFTGDVDKVADTNIFARAIGERQLLVYSMAYGAKSELAMVLPLPVAPGTGPDGVNFISLEDCPDFFGELARGVYYDGPPDEDGMLEDFAALGGHEAAPLEVHDVGAFEASFVPAPEDFGRLDERFRLPAQFWLQLSTYRDYGFAVFKLRSTPYASVHPMALEFPRRDRGRLFFPTVHMHNGRVEKLAKFDHQLYCQPEPAMHWHLAGWQDSRFPASAFVGCPAGRALLDLDFPCWRKRLEGYLRNEDTWLGRPVPSGAQSVVATA